MSLQTLRDVRARLEQRLRCVSAIEAAMQPLESAGLNPRLLQTDDSFRIEIPIFGGSLVGVDATEDDASQKPLRELFATDCARITGNPPVAELRGAEVAPGLDGGSPGATDDAPPSQPPEPPAPRRIGAPSASDSRNGMPWDEAEDGLLLKYSDEGFPVSEIARVTGRSKSAINTRLSTLRNRAKPADRWIRTPVTGEPGSVREVCERLNHVGYPAPWTPEKDLALTEALMNAAGAAAAAARIGVTREEAVARFRLLCPEPGYEAQKLLCEELRRRL